MDPTSHQVDVALFRGTGFFAGEPVDVVMTEPWVFRIHSRSLDRELPCHPDDARRRAETMFVDTVELLDELGAAFVDAGLVDDASVAADVLARPVRAVVGALDARDWCRRVLVDRHGVALDRPENMPLPSAPASSGGLEDLLACSPALSQSLFWLLEGVEAVEDDGIGWLPFGARILRAGRRPRNRLVDLARDRTVDVSMMAARGRVAVCPGVLTQMNSIALARRSWLRLLRVPGAREPLGAGVADASLRARLIAGETPRHEALRRLLPVSLIEGFEAGRNQARRYLRAGPPDIIVGPSRNDWNAIWAAVARREGARVWGVQHGGAYGEMLAHPSGDAERLRSDVFATAGWGEHVQLEPAGCETIDLPSPRLGRLRRQRTDGQGRAGLTLMFQISVFDHATLAAGQPGSRALAQRHEALVAGLDPEVRDDMRLRLRPPRFAGEVVYYEGLMGPLTRSLPRAEEPVAEMLASARLIVIPRLFSTTLLECLALDVPVMVVDDTYPDGVHPGFVDLYADLAGAGMLMTEVSAASARINDLYPDGIEEWWRDQQPVRARAQDVLARSAADDEQAWIGALTAAPSLSGAARQG